MSVKLPWHNEDLSDEERKQKEEDEVLRLTLTPFRYKRNRIAKEMKISITKVYNIRRKLVQDGKLKINDKGRIINATPNEKIQIFNDIISSEFGQIKSIQNMIDGLKKTNKNYADIIGYFYKVCMTLSLHPDNFLKSEPEVEKLKDFFVDKFTKGEAFYIDKTNRNRFLNREDASPLNYLSSIRIFRGKNNLVMSRGFLRIKNKSSGKYFRVKLSDSEREMGIIFFSKISELYRRMFILNHELGIRVDTLVELIAKFERKSIDVDGIPCEFFTIEVTEGKQENSISGGRFMKVVITQEARDLVRSLEYGKPVYTDPKDKAEFKADYNKALREFYVSIGKIQKDEAGEIMRYKKGTDEYYFTIRPSHALRHSCVHWLLRVTNNDVNTVASMFWDGNKTIPIYARSNPIEALLNEGTCYICQIPTFPDKNFQVFCKFKHALKWFNLSKEERFNILNPIVNMPQTTSL